MHDLNKETIWNIFICEIFVPIRFIDITCKHAKNIYLTDIQFQRWYARWFDMLPAFIILRDELDDAFRHRGDLGTRYTLRVTVFSNVGDRDCNRELVYIAITDEMHVRTSRFQIFGMIRRRLQRRINMVIVCNQLARAYVLYDDACHRQTAIGLCIYE